LPEVRYEQASHLSHFVGREATLASVAAWLEESAGGGHLLLTGGPGAGKSALASALAERHGALLHMMKSHRNPARMLRALIEEAAGATGSPDAAPSFEGDLQDLRASLVRTLEQLVAAKGRAIVVVDALDELEDVAHVEAIPAHAPRGVWFILTARPDRALTRTLEARHPSLRTLAIPPMSEGEVEALVQRRAVGRTGASLDAGRLKLRTAGLPLLVRRALDRLHPRSGPVDYDALPASLSDLFDDVYRSVSSASDERATLLQLLCLAREPLDARALAELSSVPLERCHAHLAALSEFLLEGRPGAFVPWHRGLAEFVQGAILGDDGAARVQGMFAEWTARDRSDYALRHRVPHHVAARRPEDALRVASDPDYQRRKIAAGLVFDLVGELEELDAARAAALRRHGHFLGRHPSALRTVSGRGTGPWLRRSAATEKSSAESAEVLTLTGHAEEVYSVAITSDGARAASASADGTAKVWDLATGRELRSLQVSKKRALSVAFSADGLRLYCGTDGEGLRMFGLDGDELGRFGDGAAMWAVTVCPSSGRVATGSRAGEVQLWSARGELLFGWSPGGVVTTVAFSSDGAKLLAGTTWNRLVVLDASSTPSAEPSLRVDDLGGTPWAAAFATGAASIVAACADGVVRQYDHGGKLVSECATADDRLYALAIAPTSGRLAFGGSRGLVYGADVGATSPDARRRAHDGAIDALAFVPQRGAPSLVASASADRSVRVFRPLQRGEGVAIDQEPVGATASSFSPDGAHFAAGTFDGQLRVWRSSDGARVASRRAHAARITSLAFSEDGAWIATGAQDGTTKVFRMAKVAEGAPMIAVSAHRAAVTCVCFVPPSGRLATGSSDQTVALWSVFGARELRRWTVDDTVVAIAAAPAGEAIAAVTRNGDVRVWRTDDGERLASISGAAPEGLARGLAFSRDGAALLLDLKDGTARGFQIDAAPTPLGSPELATHLPASFVSVDPRLRETVVRDRRTGAERAAYPHALSRATMTYDGRLIAGWVDDELHLLHFEDGS
jgi:WD40 repeat protein